MSEIERLGKYEILGTLGQGSFGVVYQGRDPYLQQDVAIKVCTLEDEDLRRRFFREAEISHRLDHPNVVGVHAFAFEGTTPYLVQEYLEGEDLRDVVRRRTAWTAERKLAVLGEIARGLEYAHSQGVVHRDIKPGNVRVLSDGRIKIMDFGIAKLANEESRLTQKGVTLGTASYLPPEQVRGSDVDHRADIFSFGVLAYELLSFQRPFRGKTISALVYQILYKAPMPLSEVWPVCPPALSALVERCLAKEIDERWPDMGALLEELDSIRTRVRDAEWPALLGADPAHVDSTAPSDASPADDSSASASEILSRSLISRTARDVSADQAGNAGKAGKAGESASGPVPTGDGRTTRPLDASEMPTMSLPPQDPGSGGAKPTQSMASATQSMAPATQSMAAATQSMAAADLRHQVPPSTEGADAGAGQLDAATTQVVRPDELAEMARERGRLGAAGDLASTQRVLAADLPLPSPPAASASEGAADPRTDEASGAETVSEARTSGDGEPGTGAEPDGEEPELATSAHQISQLVAQGELEAAMEQLEETMHRTRRADEGPEPAPGSSTSLPRAPVDGDLPTMPISRDLVQAAVDRRENRQASTGFGASEDPTLAPTGAAATTLAPTGAAATTLAPTGAEDPTLVSSSQPPAIAGGSAGAPPAVFGTGGGQPIVRTETETTAPLPISPAPGPPTTLPSSPVATKPNPRPAAAVDAGGPGGVAALLRNPKVLVFGAIGVLAILIVALLFQRGGEPEPEPDTPPPRVVESPPPPPPANVGPDLGSLTVVASPWGRVVSIRDAGGQSYPLPDDPTTPVRLDLPEGVYQVRVLANGVEPAELEGVAASDGQAEGRRASAPSSPENGASPEPGASSENATGDVPLDPVLAAATLTEPCPVVVGESRVCTLVIGEPSVSELFLDSGWWP